MTVSTILAGKGREVVSVEPSASLADAVRLLAGKRIGAAVILGADRRIAGIISERDIVRVLAERGAGALDEPVSQTMTRKVETCNESETVSSLMERMTSGKFRHMPVVDRGRVVGIVSIGDIVKHRLHEMETRVGGDARLHHDGLSVRSEIDRRVAAGLGRKGPSAGEERIPPSRSNHRRPLPDGLQRPGAKLPDHLADPQRPIVVQQTTTGIVNATASTSCVLNCSTTQLVCHTGCARQSPSQQRLPGPRLGAERVQARAAIVASIGSSAVSVAALPAAIAPRRDGNRASRCDRCAG